MHTTSVRETAFMSVPDGSTGPGHSRSIRSAKLVDALERRKDREPHGARETDEPSPPRNPESAVPSGSVEAGPEPVVVGTGLAWSLNYLTIFSPGSLLHRLRPERCPGPLLLGRRQRTCRIASPSGRCRCGPFRRSRWRAGSRERG